MFYSVKLTWTQPKPDSDQMQKVSKNHLVNALSVTEAEMRVINWYPANYQDAVVSAVTKTTIESVKQDGGSETFWELKLITDFDEKAKPFFVVINGVDLKEIEKKVSQEYSDCEVLALKKSTLIIDDELLADEMPKSKRTDPGDGDPNEASDDDAPF